MAGFNYEYSLGGGSKPALGIFKSKDTETLTKGDILNLESGEVDLAATNDAAFVGVVVGASNLSLSAEAQGVITAVDSTTEIVAILDPLAVYSVEDDNARNAGATLDISGATGAQTVAATSNADFTVVTTKRAATDRTFVKFTSGEHYLDI